MKLKIELQIVLSKGSGRINDPVHGKSGKQHIWKNQHQDIVI